MRRLAALLLLLPVATACSSSSSSSDFTPGPAKTYKLVDFQPAGTIQPGKPTTVAFTIQQPSGKPLTQFRTGNGPHTGVHLIIVRDDLSTIIHRHPPVTPSGHFAQRVVFPAPGRYLMIVDTYPRHGVLPNFQLTKYVTVAGTARKLPLGGYRVSNTVDGFHFVAPPHPRLRASQASFLTVHVTDPNGKPARFVPWYGALAHAIFFRAGTLDYFHSHVCAPGASGCASFVGATRIAGRSNAPGKLTVGVLVPTPGTWKLFLQSQPNGHLVTVPYVLHVAP
jgi:hypothetical protein